jgi:hypothetical protein
MIEDTRTSDGASPAELQRLLRAALERLVLLECRLGGERTSTADLATPGEIERWRGEAHRAEERAEAAERQRDRLFEKVLEADRLSSSLSEEGSSEPIDLAGFIAELRAELTELQRARTLAEQRTAELELQAQLRDRPQRAARPEEQARRLIAETAMAPPEAQLNELAQDLVSGDPFEQILMAGALRDLESPDAWLRETACDRLGELPPNLSAPLLAAAINREESPSVLARLIRLAGRTGVPALEPLIEMARDHSDDRVRAAAVVACLRSGASSARLSSLLADSAPRVRRRTALGATLALPEEAPPVLERLAADSDAGVRKLVAVCASILPPSKDRPATDRLSRRLTRDPDPKVRRSALRSLRVEPTLADASASTRRRALRSAPLSLRPSPAGAADSSLDEAKVTTADRPEARSPSQETPLCDLLEAEVRSTLRGCTIEQLAETLQVEVAAAERAAAVGLSEGRLVQRGQRLFAG